MPWGNIKRKMFLFTPYVSGHVPVDTTVTLYPKYLGLDKNTNLTACCLCVSYHGVTV